MPHVTRLSPVLLAGALFLAPLGHALAQATQQNPPQTDLRFPMMHVDGHLLKLLDCVEGRALEFPITLYVRGVVVSGYLAGQDRYFAAMAEQFGKFVGSIDNAEMAIGYLAAPVVFSDDPATDSQPEARCVHLRGARVFMPGQEPMPAQGAWWRGRLVSVDAFHFGALTLADE